MNNENHGLYSLRQFLESIGALIVSFNLMPPAGKVWAQFADFAVGRYRSDFTRSWLAITPDNFGYFLHHKVEIGTGMITALAQFVAESSTFLSVKSRWIRRHLAHHRTGLDGRQPQHRASRPQIRQAAAAARHELLKFAAAQLSVPVDKLTVVDGVVGVIGDESKKISYGQLIGGKKFNTRITATGTGWDMKVAPEVKAKDPKNYKIVGQPVKRLEIPSKVTGEHDYIHNSAVPGMLTAAWCAHR